MSDGITDAELDEIQNAPKYGKPEAHGPDRLKWAEAFLDYAWHAPICRSNKSLGCDCGFRELSERASEMLGGAPTQSQEAAPRRLMYSEIHEAIMAEPKRIRQQFVFAEDYDIAIRERNEARRERDLAIAHDRQPYPTAWAYEQVCKTLDETKTALSASVARSRELEAGLRDVMKAWRYEAMQGDGILDEHAEAYRTADRLLALSALTESLHGEGEKVDPLAGTGPQFP